MRLEKEEEIKIISGKLTELEQKKDTYTSLSNKRRKDNSSKQEKNFSKGVQVGNFRYTKYPKGKITEVPVNCMSCITWRLVIRIRHVKSRFTIFLGYWKDEVIYEILYKDYKRGGSI
jgi:hypothetical protein